MSPEQASFEETDCRSDYFSLGLLFYELLTGRPMYASDNAVGMMERATQGDVGAPQERRSDVPEGLGRIVMKVLARQPDERYQTAEEMGYEIERHLYHDRFGPTNVALRNYVLGLFPELAATLALCSKRFETVTPSLG